MSNQASEFYAKVEDLVTDPEFLRMEDGLRRFSLFSIVGQTNTERWHSAFLAWVLNPTGSHELGDFALRRLLIAMVMKAAMAEDGKAVGGKKLPGLTDLQRARFVDCITMPDPTGKDYNREKTVSLAADAAQKRRKLRFDVALTVRMVFDDDSVHSRKLLLVCENKVRAKEGKDQTLDYAEWAYEHAIYPLTGGTEKGGKINHVCLLYLSPGVQDGGSGGAASDQFISMNYDELVGRVLYPCRQHPALSERGRLLLDEFFQNLTSAGIAVSPYDILSARGIFDRHKTILRSMIEAAEQLKGEDGGVDSDGVPETGGWVLVSDLVTAGLLHIESRLQYKRGRTVREVRVVEKDGTTGIQVEEQVHRSVRAAAMAILGGQPCQGWPYFTVFDETSKWHGKTLSALREEYRTERTRAAATQKANAIPANLCRYADAVLGNHEETFLVLESAIRLATEADDFSLPARFSRAAAANLDYSLLLQYLEVDEAGRVDAYFRNHPEVVAKVDLNAKRARLYWDDKDDSGLGATRFFAKQTGQENKCGAYQWSQYWFVAGGKYKDISFVDAYRKVTKQPAETEAT